MADGTGFLGTVLVSTEGVDENLVDFAVNSVSDTSW